MKITRKELRSLIKEAFINENLDENLDHINKLITLILSGDSASLRQALTLAESLEFISNVREQLVYADEEMGTQTMLASFDANAQFGDALTDTYHSVIPPEVITGRYFRLAPIHNLSVHEPISGNFPTTSNNKYRISFQFIEGKLS